MRNVMMNLPAPEDNTAIAYVDGSYLHERLEFSYGVVLLYNNEVLEFCEKLNDPELALMRNVAGEIKGAEKAMRYCAEHNIHNLLIYYDYAGIAAWCTGEWKATKSGTKAYKAYFNSIKDKLSISFRKVKAHSGNKYNEIADKLAKKALGI
jgi:ribonuclease HI